MVGVTDEAEERDDDDAVIMEATVLDGNDVDDAAAVVPIDEELADSDSDDGSATDSVEESPVAMEIETDTADLD